ncbi:DC1, C1-like, Zinc finger, RING/FYVE/PHD-type [Artemisia annua]|uniref:DC1, C1-like, Zinc finger, RING/FYVE/PHD-type n=1 Tax=Artemisia annua TaxID=35608 RepID=A0A2U1L7C9_ARTAN|nr:DC1, C1-like, Zinc finger, RING/FYVE/PHD-type [Artemisia annua]
MNSGNRHFSHAHNLTMHQAHEAANMSCSGCNVLVNGTMYVCAQCNFVLHEQCFRATRSLKHPSHPAHPLTLVPYPTYPSNSFYCNTCKLTGTGLSYSCSSCEFDLHVLCAQPYSNPTLANNYSHGHEAVSQSGQNSYPAQNGYVPTSAHNQNTGGHHSYMHGQHVGYPSGQTSAHNPQYS